jgi:hypothetical protein
MLDSDIVPGATFCAMHSHPYITSIDDLNRGVTCHEEGPYSLTEARIDDLNDDNHDFGIGTPTDPGDEAWWNTTSTPLYLLVPTGTVIKKRDHTGGPWEVWP